MNRLEATAWFVDSRGRPCPLPIVDLAQALRSHLLVEVWADDRAAEADLQAFCETTGHRLLSLSAGSVVRGLVERIEKK